MGKYQPKHLTVEGINTKSKKKFAVLLPAVILVLLLLAAGICLFLRGGNLPKEKLPATEQMVPQHVTIENSYCELWMNADAAEKIRHMHVSEGDIAMEVFYMPSEAGEKELYRIYFGAADMGEYIGRLQTDSFNVPVSVASPSYSGEDFANEEEYNSYFALMEQLDVLLNSIRENENFRVDEVVPQETLESVREAEIGDWLVELPENIQWNLLTSETGYHIDFTIEMNGEQLQLYTIYVGEAGGSLVGLYNADGVEKSVSIQSYTLASQTDRVDDNQAMIYAVAMETVNDVLRAIMESDNFLE